ncbi:hypothetical protein L3X38_012605 [Prunus dulcis]|uniref:Uncharacterized protein n=1 Tax=Prunus dulcis TaxID=3755 RepID=A0AAD4WKD7_PRUDU|nr:hypothetical protein L3X38_012605 [Prunus dulcis]
MVEVALSSLIQAKDLTVVKAVLGVGVGHLQRRPEVMEAALGQLALAAAHANLAFKFAQVGGAQLLPWQDLGAGNTFGALGASYEGWGLPVEMLL